MIILFDLEQKVRVPKEDFSGKIIRRKFDNGKYFYQLDNMQWYEENDVELDSSPTLKRAIDFFLNNKITNEVKVVELNKIIISIFDGGYKARIEHNKHQFNMLNPKCPLKYREIFNKYKEIINSFEEHKDDTLAKYIFKEFEEVMEVIICIDGEIIHKYRKREKGEQ